MKLLRFLEELKIRIFGSPFDSFFTGKATEKFFMEKNRPSIDTLKRAVKLYYETKDEKFNNEAVMILLRFRVVMTDYRFEKLLKELRLKKESVIEAMASALNFIPAQKEK